MPSKRKSYTFREKLDIVKKLKTEFNNNLNKCSKSVDVDRKSINRWVNMEDELMNAEFDKKTRRRMPGAGRKITFIQVQSPLLDWVKDERMVRFNL